MKKLDRKTNTHKSQLDESYQSVPALKQSLTVEEMIAIAREEHVLHVAREGLEDTTPNLDKS